MAAQIGLKGGAAELLFEKWLSFVGMRSENVHRFRRASMGPRHSMAHDGFRVLDFLCIDCAILPKLSFVLPEVAGFQLTTRNGLPKRRKKIMEIRFPRDWGLFLVTQERTVNPTHRGKSVNHWRFEKKDGKSWDAAFAVQFDLKEVEQAWRLKAKAEKEGDENV